MPISTAGAPAGRFIAIREEATLRPDWHHRLAAAGDTFVRWFVYVLAPGALALLSLLLFLQDSRPQAQGGRTLSFHVVVERDRSLTPAQALQRARQMPAVSAYDIRLSEAPLWLLVPLGSDVDGNRLLAWPSRHAQSLRCWTADGLRPLGAADRYSASGAIRESRAGFVLDPDATDVLMPEAVLCRSRLAGPGHVTVSHWSVAGLRAQDRAFHRGAGLLEGGLLMLAFFALVMAAINREVRYLVLSVWLIFSLRLAAISIGADREWLGREIPGEWMALSRQLTIAGFFLTTYLLFTSFFRESLQRIGYRWLLRLAQALGVGILVLAMVLPFALFLPVMWVAAGVASLIGIFLLGRILVLTRARPALWFSAALALVLISTLSEIAAAAFELESLVSGMNSVLAALAASALVVLSLAEQMRAERLQRVRAETALNRSYEDTPVGLFTLEPDGRFARMNAAMQAMLNTSGVVPQEVRWQEQFGAAAWDTLRGIAAAEGGETELPGRRRGSGERRWFWVRAAAANGRIEGSLQDITERVQAVEKLRFLANHDPLTQVYSRHHIETLLDDSLAADTDIAPVAVAYLDLNRFKLINDLYRGRAGDAVLRQVARRIGRTLRSHHHLGRIGGDEFLIVMPVTALADAAATARDALNAVNDRAFEFGSQRFPVAVAAGLVEVAAGMSGTDAISSAERACDEAKHGHAGSLVVRGPQAATLPDRSRELSLIRMLSADQMPAGLYLAMQPILSLHRPDQTLDFEILLRMEDDDEEVPVKKVLDAAHASGNMARLDLWVLSQTLSWLEQHRDELPRTRFVSVNLSGASLNDPAFGESFFRVLARHASVASLLCVEITEGVALSDLQYTSRFIERVKARGASIALDDFGAGYTSFSYLRNLQADALKLDAGFVQSMAQHPANTAIVGAMVDLARNLGMRSIAEGVEDAATIETLAEIGADYVQGYAIAQPAPLAAVLGAASTASFIDKPDVAALERRLAAGAGASDGESPPYH